MNSPRSLTPRPPKPAAPAQFLEAYIAEHGLKHSRQRDRIVETFFAMGGHVSVEELVVRVRREDPRISVATVYRTMKLLADCGLALPRQFLGGQTRYEAAAGRPHHDHLICTQCGEIVEFANAQIESLQARVARSHGFEVESHKLELYGRCASCRRRRAEGQADEPAPQRAGGSGGRELRSSSGGSERGSPRSEVGP